MAAPGVCLAQDPAAVQFEKQVRPLLVKHCIKCHGPRKQEGGLRLDSREAIFKGGETGPAVVAGKPAESLLLEAVRYESLEMPPTGQLPAQAIGQLENWIAAGVAWPQVSRSIRESEGGISAADRRWWAFQPLAKPRPPRVRQDDWSRNEIDRFVLRRLRDNEMQPAPRADRATLVRRLYFDLVGLPPAPDEVNSFVQDTSPDAWEKLVDRLLDDPRYGEHWARYWLDLVRYSDSDGWNQDAYRPAIWRYRDYVVRAFNEDKPYPEFVRQQLAGDEIGEDDPQHMDAAGFLRLGLYEYNQRDAVGHWDDIMNEMTDVAGDVFLGMSMACARCHDHKFDPVPQQDYFKLRAFFEPIIWRDDLPAATRAEQQEYQRQLAAWQQATSEIQARMDALLEPYNERKWKSTVDKFPLDIQACFHKPVAERTSWEHQMAYLVSRQFIEEGGGPLKDISKEDKEKHEVLLKELAAFDNLKPKPLPALMTVTDFSGRIAPTVIPGDPEGQSIEPGFLSVLTSESRGRKGSELVISRPAVKEDSSGRRTALAAWIGRPDNPLTTRVLVNRIWQQHFGQGIVPTPNNFGKMGQLPTHPELLDWLAVTFVENGWSIKQLHKRILMSATWQQSSHHPEAELYQRQDPAEALLWRARVHRLRAEQIRDAMLSASGELEQKLGGPGVEASIPRRALYVIVFRNTTETFLHAFDAAGGLKSIAVRNTTTTPTQSLLLINGAYVLGRAGKMADRLMEMEFADAAGLVDHAFRLTWGREPTEPERSRSLMFLGVTAGQETEAIERQGLIDLCHILFNANEFLYLD
jgi:hypothetical protein